LNLRRRVPGREVEAIPDLVVADRSDFIIERQEGRVWVVQRRRRQGRRTALPYNGEAGTGIHRWTDDFVSVAARRRSGTPPGEYHLIAEDVVEAGERRLTIRDAVTVHAVHTVAEVRVH